MQTVRSLFINVASARLVLPHAAVAEIMPFRTPQAVDAAPAWFLGYLPWRDMRIPVLSFEAAEGGAVPPRTRQTRIAIVNALSGDERLVRYGLVTQGIPHVLNLDQGNLAPAEAEIGPYSLCAVRAAGQPGVIPNLDALERLLLKVL
jgi:chemosensory pili system protein ChpC